MTDYRGAPPAEDPPRRRRRRLVIGNWKMNPATVAEAVSLADAVRSTAQDGVTVGVAPPSVALAQVAEILRGSGVLIWSQDVHWEAKGAFTGQLAASMLTPFAQGAIVGHSEIRRDQGDDDARVAGKAASALRAGLAVTYCLGESLAQRRSGETDEVLRRQVRDGIGAIPRALLGHATRIAVAYEPIWAIGTGEPASGQQASAAVATIRRELDALGVRADDVSVLYGGSVSGASVAEFARADGVDGALVGGASLKPEEFAAIVDSFR